jgi:hypothetical protein
MPVFHVLSRAEGPSQQITSAGEPRRIQFGLKFIM